jgi:hypothetical protein
MKMIAENLGLSGETDRIREYVNIREKQDAHAIAKIQDTVLQGLTMACFGIAAISVVGIICAGVIAGDSGWPKWGWIFVAGAGAIAGAFVFSRLDGTESMQAKEREAIALAKDEDLSKDGAARVIARSADLWLSLCKHYAEACRVTGGRLAPADEPEADLVHDLLIEGRTVINRSAEFFMLMNKDVLFGQEDARGIDHLPHRAELQKFLRIGSEKERTRALIYAVYAAPLPEATPHLSAAAEQPG